MVQSGLEKHIQIDVLGYDHCICSFQDELRWKVTNSFDRTVVSGLTHGVENYQFGIAAAAKNGYTGIQWIPCLHDISQCKSPSVCAVP